MSKYSLTYFDIQGRAEPIRIALAYAGNDFEDKRISFEEWGKMKADTPQGSLPVCSIDGEVFWQSTAILRNIAREFDLYGKTNKEMTTVDIVISNFEEFFDKSAQVFMQHDPEKKEELSKEFGEKVVQPVKLFNKLLTENKNGGWLVGPQGPKGYVWGGGSKSVSGR
ncbi:S-crystallin SL11-like isoform X2 [Argopecten irradians]|uniref:S-crystallin SL11-like isoform X2 n=1 Tax=Argopecten irradians TaxID=31199 RepID=UPI003721A453